MLLDTGRFFNENLTLQFKVFHLVNTDLRFSVLYLIQRALNSLSIMLIPISIFLLGLGNNGESPKILYFGFYESYSFFCLKDEDLFQVIILNYILIWCWHSLPLQQLLSCVVLFFYVHSEFSNWIIIQGNAAKLNILIDTCHFAWNRTERIFSLCLTQNTMASNSYN